MGYKVYTDTQKNYETMVNLIDEYHMSGTDVLDYLTDWHGLQLLDYNFMDDLMTCELGLDLDDEEED